ncbi:MAG TPA: DUF934 domain-containing protein [Paracoccaceae bacterium]|nr:DUF934 domain-containing protein [Paracoccaceae bacterium]
MILSAAGPRPDDDPLTPLAEAPEDARALRLLVENDTRTSTLEPLLPRCLLIAIPFPSFADGRGFSLAARLRDLGFRGALRAVGSPIPDQFPMLLACGFDEVRIPDALAERQGRAAWARALAAARPPYRRRAA